MYTSFALSQQVDFQSVLWTFGEVLCRIVAYLVSWEPGTGRAALKAVACVAGLAAGLTVAILAPGLVVCVLVLVAFAAMSKP